MDQIQAGERVAFTFGDTRHELCGVVKSFCTDRAGRPAAWLHVAGFPDWLHCEPLASIKPLKANTIFARLAAPFVTVGDRVSVHGSLDELRGHFTQRFTYEDGTPGAFVELDDGEVVRVPLGELVSEARA